MKGDTTEVPTWLLDKLPEDKDSLVAWCLLQKGVSLREVGRIVAWSKTKVARFRAEAAQYSVRDTCGTLVGQSRDSRTPSKPDNGQILGQQRDTCGTAVGQWDTRPPANLDNDTETGTPPKPEQKKSVLIYKNIYITTIKPTWDRWCEHARVHKRRPKDEPTKKAQTMIASCLKLVSKEELLLVVDWYFLSPERELPRTSGHTGWQTVFAPTKVEDRAESAVAWNDRGRPTLTPQTNRGEYTGMKKREVENGLIDLMD